MPDAPLVATSCATPVGDLAVLTTPEDGVVRAAGFAPPAHVARSVPVAMQSRGWAAGHDAAVADAVTAWAAGDAAAVARVPIDQEGGRFHREVWDTMRAVPAGATVSYQELAHMCGRPRAMRAVGTACARNGIALFVPCHRVIRAGGVLGRYGLGSLELKIALLEHEGCDVRGDDESATVIPVHA